MPLPPHPSPLLSMAALALAASAVLSGVAVARGSHPSIRVLGTVDLLIVETTPLVIEGRLWRFESVRPECVLAGPGRPACKCSLGALPPGWGAL